MKTLLSALLTVAALAFAQQAAAPWTETYQRLNGRFIGPEGNRFSAVSGVPGDPDVYDAGAASGGVYKTVEGGVHWPPGFDGQPVLSIGALAVAQSDPNIVWAGTGEGAIASIVAAREAGGPFTGLAEFCRRGDRRLVNRRAMEGLVKAGPFDALEANPARPLRALADVSRFLVRKYRPVVVAVTGSYGKTTTKDAIAHVLGGRYRVMKSEGNLNNHFGLPLQLLRLEPEHEVAVVELAMSHAGEIAALTRIAQPNLGLVTNVAPVHLGFFNSVAEIARAKFELIAGLPGGSTAVLNADDEYVSQFGRDFQGRVVSYALEHPADVRPALVEGRPRIDAAGLGHPLLSEETCVRNDVRLDDDQRVLIVSGSNMSGKSTLLRALGVNVVLALAGAQPGETAQLGGREGGAGERQGSGGRITGAFVALGASGRPRGVDEGRDVSRDGSVYPVLQVCSRYRLTPCKKIVQDDGLGVADLSL